MPLQYMLVGEHAACCSSISIVSLLCLLRLRGNDAVSGFFLPTLYFAHFPCCPSFLLCTFFVSVFFFIPSLPFLLPSVRLSAILSPCTLRSTTQQPLNYSHQTTLCIFLAVPLHSSRMLPPPSSPSPFPVSLLACAHTRACTLSCTCSLAYVILHPFGFLPPPLMEASCSCLIFAVFKSEKRSCAAHGQQTQNTRTHMHARTDSCTRAQTHAHSLHLRHSVFVE